MSIFANAKESQINEGMTGKKPTVTQSSTKRNRPDSSPI